MNQLDNTNALKAQQDINYLVGVLEEIIEANEDKKTEDVTRRRLSIALAKNAISKVLGEEK